ASTNSDYTPLYYASAVLPDGKVIVEGGEYNNDGSTEVWTNKGAIYDPVLNKWATVKPPTGWSQIGDSECVVLADGTFMLANGVGYATALLDESTLTWTI